MLFYSLSLPLLLHFYSKSLIRGFYESICALDKYIFREELLCGVGVPVSEDEKKLLNMNRVGKKT